MDIRPNPSRAVRSLTVFDKWYTKNRKPHCFVDMLGVGGGETGDDVLLLIRERDL